MPAGAVGTASTRRCSWRPPRAACWSTTRCTRNRGSTSDATRSERHVHHERDRHHRLCPADRHDIGGHQRHRHRPDGIVVLDGVRRRHPAARVELNWDITSGDTANRITANVSASVSCRSTTWPERPTSSPMSSATTPAPAFDDYFTKAEGAAAMIADNQGPVRPSVTPAPTARTEPPAATDSPRTNRCYRPGRTRLDGGRPNRSHRFGSCRPLLRHDAGRQHRPVTIGEAIDFTNDGPNTSITSIYRKAS